MSPNLFWKSERIFHSDKPVNTDRVIHGIKLAVFGIPFPPVTEMIGSKLVCYCRRSAEFNGGCRVCWSVDIGNKSLRLRKSSSEDLVSLMDESAMDCLTRFGKEMSLIRLRTWANHHSRLVELLLILSEPFSLTQLVELYDIQKLGETVSSQKLLSALRRIIKGRITPMIRHIHTGNKEMLIRVYSDSRLNQCLDQIRRYREYLGIYNPEALKVYDDSLASCHLEGHLNTFTTQQTPGIVQLSMFINEGDRISYELGFLTVSGEYMNTLQSLHKGVLIHSSEVAWRFCSQILEPFTAGIRKDQFINEILDLEGAIEVEVSECISANVFDYIESMHLVLRFDSVIKQIDAFEEMFKILVSVEFGVFTLKQAWNYVGFWETDTTLHSLWWSFHSHMSSIRSYLRLTAVESNQRKLRARILDAKSWFEQIECHNRFISNLKRDLFLFESASVYKQHILLLAQCAVDFKLIVERCHRFGFSSSKVSDQLIHVKKKFESSSNFLRRTLKPHVWTFV